MANELETLATLSLPIIELSHVDMVMYSDGSGSYHIHASYLYQMGNDDELVGSFDGRIDHIQQLPLIEDATKVTIRSENGGVLGTTTIGEIATANRNAQN